jgi:pSer/pThr/pTyr-binding forkhead associated (FHA) protein
MGPKLSGRETAGRGFLRLKWRERELVLPAGSYVIGRSTACQLALDDAMVSRRHARLVIDDGGARIEDLGSSNGVYVNGERVDESRKLEAGDQLTIGSQLLAVDFGPLDSIVPRRAAVPTQTGLDPVVPAMQNQEEPQPDWETSTRRTGGLSLIVDVAERMLALGQTHEAENLMISHLARALDDARSGRAQSPDTVEAVLNFGTHLAAATRDKRWVNYVLDLLTALRMPVSPALVEPLRDAASRAGAVEVAKLQAYRSVLYGLVSSFDQVRTLELIDRLSRAGKAG